MGLEQGPTDPVLSQHQPLPPDNQVLFRSPVIFLHYWFLIFYLQILIYAYAKNKLCPGLIVCGVVFI